MCTHAQDETRLLPNVKKICLTPILMRFHAHARLRPATEHLTWHRTKHRL